VFGVKKEEGRREEGRRGTAEGGGKERGGWSVSDGEGAGERYSRMEQ